MESAVIRREIRIRIVLFMREEVGIDREGNDQDSEATSGELGWLGRLWLFALMPFQSKA